MRVIADWDDESVTGDDLASEVYEQCEPRPLRVSGLKSWLRMILDAWLNSGWPEPIVVHQIKYRRNGHVVYEVRTHTAIPLRSAQESIARDIASLTVDQFRAEYGIPVDPNAAPAPEHRKGDLQRVRDEMLAPSDPHA